MRENTILYCVRFRVPVRVRVLVSASESLEQLHGIGMLAPPAPPSLPQRAKAVPLFAEPAGTPVDKTVFATPVRKSENGYDRSGEVEPPVVWPLR